MKQILIIINNKSKFLHTDNQYIRETSYKFRIMQYSTFIIDLSKLLFFDFLLLKFLVSFYR